MTTTAVPSSSSTLDRLSLYLSTCTKAWICLYLAFCCLVSLQCVMLHVASVGLLLCLMSYFRLPATEPSETFRLLGRDPLNLDGSPSRSASRGVLGLIARRAAPLDGPENSLEAIKKVKKAGAKSIHCDLIFTADGIAIALRPANLNELDKSQGSKIRASDLTWKDAQKLDLAAEHPLKDEFSPAHPPTIEELADLCLAEDLRLFIEIAFPDKMSLDNVADYVVNSLFKKRPKLYGKAVVTSAWPHVIYAIRQKEPRVVCGLVWSPTLLQTTFPRSYSMVMYHVACIGDRLLQWSVHEFLWYFLGVVVIVVDKNVVNAPYIQMWRSRGIRLIASPVNRSLERLYMEKHLRLTCMADSMDEIGIDKLLEDN
jgi:glycerophosphoinositol glycerophosphodiesterase